MPGYYFAIFAGVIVGLMLEPLPGSVVGLIGLAVVTVLHPFVLYSPEELARPGFNPPDAALAFALSGFSNATVWLIFAAFMFALGYEKSGLGKRIALTLVKSMGRNTLTLGYAIVAAETLLAPVTPSNTARSGGTIYPIIRNIPGALRFEAGRSVGAADRLLHHVGGRRVGRGDELDVHDELRAQPARRRVRPPDRQYRDHLARLVPWLRADRDSAAACGSAAHLLVLSAGHHAQRESRRMGGSTSLFSWGA